MFGPIGARLAIIRERTSSVIKSSVFIIAVHKGWRHVEIDVNHDTWAYLLVCLKRVSVVWRGVIFGHLTTGLSVIRWILVDSGDTTGLSDGLKQR